MRGRTPISGGLGGRPRWNPCVTVSETSIAGLLSCGNAWEQSGCGSAVREELPISFPTLRMLAVLSCLLLTLQSRAVTVTFFPASAWSADIDTLNRNLGLTNGYTFESFEDETLEPGLALIHSSYGFGDYYGNCPPVASTDPRSTNLYFARISSTLHESGRLFYPAAWHGNRTVCSSDDLMTDAPPTPPKRSGWPYSTFRFSPGASSVGIGLSGQAYQGWSLLPPENSCQFDGYFGASGIDVECVVTVNGTNVSFSLPAIAGGNWTAGIARNGYLRLDAEADETISAIGFLAPKHHEAACVTENHEVLAFDYVAYKPHRRVFSWIGGACYYNDHDSYSCTSNGDWSDPCNWILDAVRGVGVPGTNDLDKVLIPYNRAGGYPTNALGRISELHILGSRVGAQMNASALFGGELTLIDKLLLRHGGLGVAGGPVVPLHVTLLATGVLQFRTELPFDEAGETPVEPDTGFGGRCVFDNYGLMPSPQASFAINGPWTVSGGDDLEPPVVFNNFGEMHLNRYSVALYGRAHLNNYGRIIREGPGKTLLVGSTVGPGQVNNHTNGILNVDSGSLEFGQLRLRNDGLMQAAANSFCRIQQVYSIVVSNRASFLGPGTFLISSSLRLQDDAQFENVDFGGLSVNGPGTMRVTGRARVTGFAALMGVEEPAEGAGRQLIDTSSLLLVQPGAELHVESNSNLGRRLENHGSVRIDGLISMFQSLTGGLPVVFNHGDGILEFGLGGFVPGGNGTLETGACTNIGIVRVKSAQGSGASWVNQGRVEVLEGGSFSPTHRDGFTQLAGTLDLGGGAELRTPQLNILGGELTGSGSILTSRSIASNGTVFGGILRPGHSPGALVFDGLHFDQLPGSLIDLEIGGRLPGTEYDQVRLQSAVALAGTLRVRFINEFVPASGDQFPVVWFGSQPTGDFQAYDLASLPSGLGWVVGGFPDRLSLLVTNGPPAEPPRLLSAASLDGIHVQLCFNESLNAATASDLANYRLNDGSPGAGFAAVRLLADGRSIVLRLATRLAGPFAIHVRGVLDHDLPPRTAALTAAVTPQNWLAADIGTPGDPAFPGGSFTCGSDLVLNASGSSVGLAEDHFHFLSQPVCGDFDLKARIEFLDAAGASLAGLIAREGLGAGSRSAFLGLFPDAGFNTLIGFGREAPDAERSDWRTLPAQFIPGPREGYRWLRLQRQGDKFEGFYSADGVNWSSFAARTVAWNRRLLVGFGLGAYDNTRIATARFLAPTLTQTPPIPFTCRPDLTTNAPAGATAVVVHYDPPEGAGVVCVPPSGTAFAVGTNTVECVGADADGCPSRCTFSVVVVATPLEPPVLTPVIDAEGTQLTIFWDAAVPASFMLEASDSVDDPRWELIGSPVVEANGRRSVRMPAPADTRFFRLRDGVSTQLGHNPK